jgi:hypothetical protein
MSVVAILGCAIGLRPTAGATGHEIERKSSLSRMVTQALA